MHWSVKRTLLSMQSVLRAVVDFMREWSKSYLAS
jgi:hypothetical protein